VQHLTNAKNLGDKDTNMSSLNFTENEVAEEIQSIIEFIRAQAEPDRHLLVGLSGGLDSDVTARLCVRAVSSQRIKCFTVLQDEFDPRHLQNARNLAEDLGIDLVEIPFPHVPKQLITIMAEADPEIGFLPDGLLDVARSKCSIRTFIFSAYAERGYLVVGPSNRTELELGYFLPFGDGLSHLSPIAHLYKTQVQQLAPELGTREEVIAQPPSAGFWIGDQDLEGIAYWLYNGGPIKVDLNLNDQADAEVHNIFEQLSFKALDEALLGINEGQDASLLVERSGLGPSIIQQLQRLLYQSGLYKRRQLGARIQ
jgi:NAD+ synthase